MKLAKLVAGRVRRQEREEEDRVAVAGWQVSPFLHWYEDRVESPLAGAVIPRSQGGGEALATLLPGHPGGATPSLGRADFERLVAGAFLVADPVTASHASRLRYVSLETCSTCNHRCDFCPVSVAPRPHEVMPQELFVRIVDEVVAVGEPDLIVFLNNYNEPTVDPLFLERLRVLLPRRVPTAILTNGSRLTGAVAAEIRALGTLRYLGVNLPCVDAERYRLLHGTRDLDRILRHVDALIAEPIAEENAFVVLGYGDERHDRDLAALQERFAGSGWAFRRFVVQSRSGLVKTTHAVPRVERLGGCEQTGSRPLEHLHVTASGRVIFCCQDYYERYPVGDMNTQGVAEVLRSEELARLRRWAYGAEEAPEDFICRGCEFALQRP